jgi:serine/threonine protein kinase/tetratricopeptide (TPR) repeat protein
VTASQTHTRAAESRSSALAELVDRLTSRVQAGERLDLGRLLAEHPDYADELRRLLPAVGLLGDLSRSREAVASAAPLGPAAADGTLGDFRIVREVGRGGMGVVYEAEQISLRRRVALKVLPFAAVMDPRSLQRFRNEALAAASLDHPHVVKVYGVGCERGVHFIALQYIDGRPLSELIRNRRGQPVEPPTATAMADATATYTPGRPAPAKAKRGSSATPRGDDAYYRRVAEWGCQAADALEHAHALGVVHRDVKPGNILVDGAGKVFVADFGLAKLAADPGVTGTGDLLGTVRYMSPEQANARHDLVDHRSDVYSLGVTLYELLALQPAFTGPDRQAVLSAVLSSDPAGLRSYDSGIPRDLETVVLKAMDKDPARRYQSAGEFAADLRRMLAHQPVRAKRPTLADGVGKWTKRHRGMVRLGVTALAVVAATTTAAAVLVWQESGAKERALADKTAALADRERALVEKDAALARADANFLQALDATATLVRALEKYRPDLPPEVAAQRAAVLGRAKEFFTAFLAENRHDPARRREALIALRYLSEVMEQQNDLLPAADVLNQALELADGLRAEFSGDHRSRAEFSNLQERIGSLSISLNFQASQFAAGGRFERAEERSRLADRLLERWGNRDHPSYEIMKAEMLGQLAANLEGTHHTAEAIVCRRMAIACTERRDRLPPRLPMCANQQRADNRAVLAGLLLQSGSPGEAEEVIESELAAVVDERMYLEPSKNDRERWIQVGSLPDDVIGRLYMAPSDRVRGQFLALQARVHRARGQNAEADAAAKRAVALLPPGHPDRMWLQLTSGDPVVRDPADVAKASEAELATAPPTDWGRRTSLATVLGVARLQLGDWKGAVEAFEQAHAIRPGGVRGALFYLALAHCKGGDAANACRVFDEAVALAEKHQPKDPELLRLRREVGAEVDRLTPPSRK